jgi:hypothetical protein
MWGWKPVERNIEPSVSLEQARSVMSEAGFNEHVTNPDHVIFRRTGTQLAVSGEKLPLEVALAKSEEGLFLQVRYDTFALFDTGDLAELANELVAKLGG